MADDRDADASRLAAESLARDDPTGWFERLYAEAAEGKAIVPWDRGSPNPLLVGWTRQSGLDGAGRRALVVGCGLGSDAEHIAALGFHTTAFDIAKSAVSAAQERFPMSTVDYVVADLLRPPTEWLGAFDLVVESMTVQSMPLWVRGDAIARMAQLVAPGGELIVICMIRQEREHVDGPPWPLTRTEVDSFAVGGLRPVTVEQVSPPGQPDVYRWRALFRRV